MFVVRGMCADAFILSVFKSRSAEQRIESDGEQGGTRCALSSIRRVFRADPHYAAYAHENTSMHLILTFRAVLRVVSVVISSGLAPRGRWLDGQGWCNALGS